MNPTALSLFSGIGGFCEGFRLADFDIVGSVESDKYAAANYRKNFPATNLYEGDIRNFLQGECPTGQSDCNELTRGVDVVFGGPPCQGYSQIGPRNLEDPRNILYKELCRVAEEVKAKFVVIENVPNMFMMKKGHFRTEIFSELAARGFDNIGWVKLNAAHFGVPQERMRIFIIACSSEIYRGSLQDLLENCSASLTRKPVCVGDAISDLPKEPACDSGVSVSYPELETPTHYQKEMRIDLTGNLYGTRHKKRWYRQHTNSVALHNHHTKDIQAKRLRLIKLLEPGAKANSLPKHIWNNARPEKWRRLDYGKTSHTLLAQMHRDLSEWVHPEHHRWITVREALRIQSFHDGFVLDTSEWQQLKQVGNAVPPLLGYVPAMCVRYALSALNGVERPFELKGQQSLFA